MEILEHIFEKDWLQKDVASKFKCSESKISKLYNAYLKDPEIYTKFADQSFDEHQIIEGVHAVINLYDLNQEDVKSISDVTR